MGLQGVADMDTLSFNAAVESMVRIQHRKSYELAWMTHVAAQGSTKNVKEFTKHFEKEFGAPKKSAQAFHAKFGKGI